MIRTCRTLSFADAPAVSRRGRGPVLRGGRGGAGGDAPARRDPRGRDPANLRLRHAARTLPRARSCWRSKVRGRWLAQCQLIVLRRSTSPSATTGCDRRIDEIDAFLGARGFVREVGAASRSPTGGDAVYVQPLRGSGPRLLTGSRRVGRGRVHPSWWYAMSPPRPLSRHVSSPRSASPRVKTTTTHGVGDACAKARRLTPPGLGCRDRARRGLIAKEHGGDDDSAAATTIRMADDSNSGGSN